MRPNTIAVFRERVDRSAGVEACWPWTGTRGSAGYGQFRLNGKSLLAHRLAYELVHGPIPTGLQICHRCDNPPCCNPRHMFLGTVRDNALDRTAKGRGKRFPGELHASAVFTNAQVQKIRERYTAGGVTQQALADEFGVGLMTINRIIHRRTYRDAA